MVCLFIIFSVTLLASTFYCASEVTLKDTAKMDLTEIAIKHNNAQSVRNFLRIHKTWDSNHMSQDKDG